MERLIQPENDFKSIMHFDFWWSIFKEPNASGLDLKVGISTT